MPSVHIRLLCCGVPATMAWVGTMVLMIMIMGGDSQDQLTTNVARWVRAAIGSTARAAIGAIARAAIGAIARAAIGAIARAAARVGMQDQVAWLVLHQGHRQS